MSNMKIKGVNNESRTEVGQRAVVVSGEASESDEDVNDVVTGDIGSSSIRMSNTCGTIISGEAPESDDDKMSVSSVSIAIDAVSCAPYVDLKLAKPKKSRVRYNSLLHKKLYECNELLAKDILDFYGQSITNGINHLTNTNASLLKSELTLQDAGYHLRNASLQSREASDALGQVTAVGFLHCLKT